MRIINLLANYKPLSNLKSEILYYLADKFHERYYSKNQVVINKGEIADGLGIVSCGQLNIIHENRNDSTKIVETEFYNDIALVSQASSIMTIVSNNISHCYVLPASEFYSISAKYPAISNFFSKVVKKKIYSMIQQNNRFLALLPNSFKMSYDNSSYHPFVQKAVNYINNNYTQTITLDCLSHECGVSKYHLSRLFKKNTGYTFKKYLNKVRISKAKSIMINHNKSVTESCYAVGFNDLSHFSRTFNQIEKIYPSEYLKKIRRK